MCDTSIKIRSLRKAYDGNEVIKGISFDVKKGEIFAFLGPNGAGKSTVISIISTLLEYEKGSVEIEGYTLGVNNKDIRKCIGIVFQNSMLDDALTVKKNLFLRCGLYHIYGDDAIHRVQQLCDACHLNDIIAKPVHTLSGGQRRRVDIARALIPNPKMLILDEPSTGLDPSSRRDLWNMIQDLHDEYQMTVFLTTHYLEETAIANHICMIKKGEIMLDTTQEELQKQFGKEELILYTKAIANVKRILQPMRLTYTCEEDCITIQVMNFYQMMSILRKCEIYVQRIEVTTKKMEDIYLELMGDEVV